MNWKDFQKAAPQLARLAEERFEATGLSLVGTVTAGGEARISPVEPLIADGELYLGMMWQSRKALDLLRHPRCLVHSVVCDKNGREGEVKLRGRAVDVMEPEERARFADAQFQRTGWRPREPFHLFALDIEGASYVRYSGESGDQTVVRWRPGSQEEQFVRAWSGSGYDVVESR